MSQATSCTLSRSTEGLHFAGTALSYRITGLTSYNLDRLRITLKASPQQTGEGLFHIDTVDLYNSRCREMFAEACAKYLKAQCTSSKDLDKRLLRLRDGFVDCNIPLFV